MAYLYSRMDPRKHRFIRRTGLKRKLRYALTQKDDETWPSDGSGSSFRQCVEANFLGSDFFKLVRKIRIEVFDRESHSYPNGSILNSLNLVLWQKKVQTFVQIQSFGDPLTRQIEIFTNRSIFKCRRKRAENGSIVESESVLLCYSITQRFLAMARVFI